MLQLFSRAAEYISTYDYGDLTTTTAPESTGMSWGLIIFYLIIAVLIIAATWRIFTKAGRPGWAAIIPFYNTYTLIKVAGKPGWWLILYFIPIVNIVIMVIVLYNVAKAFGKGVGYTLLLIFLPFIGFPMLAWGNNKYRKPVGA